MTSLIIQNVNTTLRKYRKFKTLYQNQVSSKKMKRKKKLLSIDKAREQLLCRKDHKAFI